MASSKLGSFHSAPTSPSTGESSDLHLAPSPEGQKMIERLEWKRRAARVYSHLRPSPAPDKPVSVVLTYHSVGTGPLALPSDVFRRQMEWLKQNTSVVSLSELVKGQIQSSKAGIV